MTEQTEALILGAGPAGLACALALAEAGLRAVLLDDNPRAGGQIFRTRPGEGPAPDYPEKDARGDDLRAALARHAGRIDHRPRHAVVAAHEGRRIWALDEAAGRVRAFAARHLVVAQGAVEAPLPVPGWTLPGVYLLGGLQNLVKSAGIVPEGRVVLGGAGPLLLLVAAQLARMGVNVVGVVDAAGLPTPAQMMGLVRRPGLLARGAGFELSLRRRGIPVWRHSAIARIDGGDRPESATIVKLDGDWRPVPGSERSLAVDVVGIGYGLRPNVEVTQLLGCAHAEDPDLGGLAPRRSADMETSVPDVFAIGDGAGIGGVDVALAEGRVAALAIARRLGARDLGRLVREAEDSRRLLALDRPFHDALARWSRVRPGILALIDDDTVVCRCEDVTAADIRAALDEGLTHPAPLKMRTRAGMGLCQGRTCGGAVRAMIAAHLGVDESEVPAPTVRVPLRPVPAAAFADLPITPDDDGRPS